jgi:aspartate-semialdehyde dehydrogenase
VVVDDSPAFRQDPEVPLVVPEVNPDALAGYEARSLVASPASTSTFAALALKPLAELAGLARVVATTYQAVSGEGQEGVEQLEREAQALMNGRDPGPPTAIPHRIAFNLVPMVGALDQGGHAEQEVKLREETRRLLGDPALRISATAVRVPVFYGHAVALDVETSRKLSPDEARERLRHAPGVKVVDDPREQVYPMPMLAVNDDALLVGRVREDPSHDRALHLFLVGDNLRKGAATNVVQIAELLASRYL